MIFIEPVEVTQSGWITENIGADGVGGTILTIADVGILKQPVLAFLWVIE